MFHQPPNQIEIRVDGNTARFSSLSAAITYLEIDGVVAIAQVTREAILESFASVICAPWPNRIADGIWNGKKFPGNDPHGNALHGLVFDKDFQVAQQSENSVTYVYRLMPNELYPFELEIGATYVLASDGLTATFFARNLGSAAAPYGVAAHPYFNVFPESTFEFAAKTQSINNEKQIPLGVEPNTKAQGAQVFGKTNLDDCFSGLAGEVRISHPDGSRVSIWQDDAFKYLMVYTGHHLQQFGFPNPGLAIEPQTCPANAFNTGEDLIWLSPGEHWSANWGITAKGRHD